MGAVVGGVPGAGAVPTVEVQTQSQTQIYAKGEVTIEYRRVTVAQEGGATTLVFEDQVRVRYGETELTCDRFEFNEQTGEAKATGRVTLVDPDATVSGEELELNTKTRTGSMRNGALQIDVVSIRAATIAVGPERYDATQVEIWFAREGRPPAFAKADTVTLYRDERIVGRNLRLVWNGVQIGPIPVWETSLDRRSGGIQFPKIDQTRDRVGIRWDAEVDLDAQTVVNFGFGAIPDRYPRGNVTIARSLLGAGSPEIRLVPRSEFDERARDGWFNRVTQRTVAGERRDTGLERSVLSVTSFWNNGATARPVSARNIYRPWEVSWTGATTRDGWSYQARTTVSETRLRPGEDSVTRMGVTLASLAPNVRFGQLRTHLRFDAFGTVGEQQYGWLRGEAGLIWNPEPWITVGAAYMSSADAGRPDFPVDPLASRHGWLVRADYTRGPYFVRFLTKYDARRGGWYSNEYEIAIAADVFEPYIYSRDFPNTFQVGVRFRLDRFRDRVRARIRE